MFDSIRFAHSCRRNSRLGAFRLDSAVAARLPFGIGPQLLRGSEVVALCARQHARAAVLGTIHGFEMLSSPRQAWQMAIAKASAASFGRGKAESPKIR